MTDAHRNSAPTGRDVGPTDEYWLFEGLSDGQVDEILSRARRWTAEPQQVIFSQGDPGDAMYLVASGRVQISVRGDDGEETILKQHDVGDHFGELVLLSGERRITTATTVVTTDLIELSSVDFLHFVHHMPRFAANVSRVISNWVQDRAARVRPLPLQSVALFRTSVMADHLAFSLSEGWIPTVASLTVVTDRPQAWLDWSEEKGEAYFEGHQLELVVYNESEPFRIPATSMEHKVLFDLADIGPAGPAIDSVLNQSEQVWIAVAKNRLEEVVSSLNEFNQRLDHLRQRTRFLWCYEEPELAPDGLQVEGLASRPAASVRFTSGVEGTHHVLPADSERLVRNLQGVELGLALGGGGARGLAHFGALKAFEDNGIRFDRIAGSSFGSLAAVFFAAGISPEKSLEIVAEVMKTPPWIRWVPKNRRWYMLWAFRFAHIEKSIRVHFGDARLNQLMLQVYTVCVDLVSGQPIVRESSDAVHAVMESINHPGMSRPRMRNGKALIDGAVLINLPANVLRERRCEYIVSVDIGSQLEAKFAGNTPDTPAERMRNPSYLETLVRTTEIQMSRLASIHASEGDFLIKPDTSRFPFDDFSRGEALFEAGYRAASDAIPRLKEEIENLKWSVEEQGV